MNKLIVRPVQVLLVFVVLLGSAVSTMAVTGRAASNILSPQSSGEGEGVVSGYVVSGIHYGLLPADPGQIGELEFGLVPASGGGPASQVSISLDQGATWSSCRNIGGPRWTCPASARTASVTSLRVIAAQ